MSQLLESVLDRERLEACAANDVLLACCTHDCSEGRICPKKYGTPTTRRYPRTLADAFPDVRAKAGEHHIQPPLWKRVALFIRRRFA